MLPRVPRVSVLMPVRDEQPFLTDALGSLLDQTLEDIEVIVVDDGSRDASAEIADQHARRDRRVRVVRQPRLGIVAALERARAAARGPLLARMDGDDVALPQRLELQVAALEDEALDAVGGQVEPFPPEAVGDGGRRYTAWINGLTTVAAARLDAFVECPIPHPALLVRATAVATAGGYRDQGWPEDYDLPLRLWRAGARFRNVAAPVLRWREHPARASRTDAAYALDAFVRCKAHHLAASVLRDCRGAAVWGAGPVGKSIARELARLGVPLAAFVEVDPRKLGNRVHGAPVVSVDEAPRGPGIVALGAVAGPEARQRVRAAVCAQGFIDGVDFIAVA
jgi:hypothetical protein